MIRAGCVVSVAAAVRSPQGIQSAGENVRWKTCLADVFFEVDVSFVKSDEMEKLEGMETVPASHFPHSQVSRPVSCLTNAHPTSIKPRDETPNLHIQTRDDDDGMITTRAHQMITHVALVVVKPVSHIKGLPRAASPLRPPQETERPPSTICRQPGPREAPTLEGTASRASGHASCTVAQASPKGPIQSRLFQTDKTRRLGRHGCARKKAMTLEETQHSIVDHGGDFPNGMCFALPAQQASILVSHGASDGSGGEGKNRRRQLREYWDHSPSTHRRSRLSFTSPNTRPPTFFWGTGTQTDRPPFPPAKWEKRHGGRASKPSRDSGPGMLNLRCNLL